MSIPIRVLAVRAVASFLIAACILTASYFSGILTEISDTSDATMTGSQMALIFFGWVIFSPLVETAVLAMLYKVASSYLSLKNSAALAAIILAALHGSVWWVIPPPIS